MKTSKMQLTANNAVMISIVLLVKTMSFSFFSPAGKSDIPLVSSFNHCASERLAHRPPKKVLRKDICEWHISFSGTKDHIWRQRRSVLIYFAQSRKRKNTVSARQGGCSTLHHGNTIITLEKSENVPSTPREHHSSVAMLSADFDHVESINPRGHEDNWLGWVSYCERV